MMYSVFNRSRGDIVLPDNKILSRNRIGTVKELDLNLRNLEKAGVIIIKEVNPVVCRSLKCTYTVSTESESKPYGLQEPGSDNTVKYGPKFGSGKPKRLSFRLQLPFNFKPHSDLAPYLRWIKPITKEAVMLWRMRYRVVSNGIPSLNEIDTVIKTPANRGPIYTPLSVIPGMNIYEYSYIEGSITRIKGSRKDTLSCAVVPLNFTIQYKLKDYRGTRSL